VSELHSNNLKALWETGVPLNEAWIEFAVFFDHFALRALRTYPENDASVLGTDHPRYIELKKGWLPPSWEGRRKKLAITMEGERHHLLGEIYSGNLWAIGFITLPSGTDEPVRVPRRLFFAKNGEDRAIRPDIDWDAEELKDGDRCYFDVRIIRHPVWANVAIQASQPEVRGAAPLAVPETSDPQAHPESVSPPRETSSRKEGRPNMRDRIRAKVEELWNSDPHFRQIPHRIDQAREIRARLAGEGSRHRDDMPGYRSTSIQRIIGRIANQRGRSE